MWELFWLERSGEYACVLASKGQAHAAWRVLDADAVYASLKPAYPAKE